MYLMSNYGYRNEKDKINAKIVAVDTGSLSMSLDESRKYKRFLFGLSCFLAVVVIAFSPLAF